jgi:hypothetical protein
MLTDLSQLTSVINDRWEYTMVAELAETCRTWREAALEYRVRGYHLSMRAGTTAIVTFLALTEQLEEAKDNADASPRNTEESDPT